MFTATRLAVPASLLVLWAWLGDGTLVDPANLLLLPAFGAGLFALVSVRRYWHVRKTSRSRRKSSLLV
jgi:hypothetical protein